MILQALHALYDRLKDDPAYEVAPPGYSIQKISFKVVLHPDGRLFEIQRTLHEGRPKQVRVPGAAKSPGSGLNPCFLWDNTGYLLGFKPDDENPERTQKAFDAFRARHLDVRTEIAAPSYDAVCRFLEEWNPADAPKHAILAETTSGFGLFQIVGEAGFVHEDPVVDAWWQRQLSVRTEAEVDAQCLLTGQRAAVARLQPMIKGVAGGNAQSSLVGFNDESFCSYGKEQSINAPIGERAAAEYGAALNALLDGPMRSRHRMLLADATVAFWTDRRSLVEDVFAQFAERGSDLAPRKEEVQDGTVLKQLSLFLDALRQGLEKVGDLAGEAKRTQFYLLGLSPNQGRVAVRFFLHGSVASMIEHLREHHRDIGIERQYGDDAKRPDPEFPSSRQLLDETCPRDKRTKIPDREKIPHTLSAPLLRAVLTGCRYPESLLGAVIRRIRADREINYLRACIVKGCLIRNHGKEIPMSLDTERTEPAYTLGRLFAVLERVQEVAHLRQTGQFLERGIRDNYFTSASSTPASVFPRLERLSTHHRRQLSGAQKNRYDTLIAEIKQGQAGIPNVLQLPDQGLFSLGYYHQWIELRKKNKVQEDNQEE